MTMNKTLLTATVLGVLSVVASSSSAFAENASTYCKPGFYAGVQGGRSDTFYSPQKALGPVWYMYHNTSTSSFNGIGIVNTTSYTTFPMTHVDDIGLGGRIYAGYQFNPLFAMEMGYTQYAKTDYSATAVTKSSTTISYPPSSYNSVTTDKYSGEITEHAIDVVGKETLPLNMLKGVGIYLKEGLAYIAADNHINGNSSTVYTESAQKVSPVVGAGVNYTIPNTNLSVDASYTRIFSCGSIPNAKLAALGLEYKFA